MGNEKTEMANETAFKRALDEIDQALSDPTRFEFLAPPLDHSPFTAWERRQWTDDQRQAYDSLMTREIQRMGPRSFGAEREYLRRLVQRQVLEEPLRQERGGV